jgi:hypothetical protein
MTLMEDYIVCSAAEKGVIVCKNHILKQRNEIGSFIVNGGVRNKTRFEGRHITDFFSKKRNLSRC